MRWASSRRCGSSSTRRLAVGTSRRCAPARSRGDLQIPLIVSPSVPRGVKLPPGSLRSLTGTVFDAAAGRAGSRIERREEQRAMALDVARALDLGRMALIEAGTGVGKSLAYLVPAAIWAASSGQRVMISTHTKNLQSQLSENDVTRLRAMLRHVSPRVADMLAVTVLRGRNNYLCRRNLDRVFARVVDPDRGIDAASVALLARVMVWAESTVDRGSRGAAHCAGPRRRPGIVSRQATPPVSATGVRMSNRAPASSTGRTDGLSART